MKSLLGLLFRGLMAIAARICDYSACGCSIVEIVLTTGLAVEYLTGIYFGIYLRFGSAM